MTMLKIATLLMWLGLVASFFIPAEASWIGWCQIAFGLMAVSHFIEFLFYIPTLRKRGSMAAHFVQVMLFGYIYYKQLKRQAPESV